MNKDFRDWKPGSRTRDLPEPNTQLRLSLAIAKILKINPRELAEAMSFNNTKAYAVRLYNALGEVLTQK